MNIDIHLVWYAVSDTTTTAPRADVRRWADELGLPEGALSKGSKVGAFVKACQDTVITYTDAEDVRRQLVAVELVRKGEFITWEVRRDDGMKLAQLKLFSARRTREGIVPGTHVLKSQIRKIGVTERDREATEAWLAQAQEAFRTEQGYAPWHIIRRLMRDALTEKGVPMYRRKTVFYTYDEDVERSRRAGEFLMRAVQDADFAIVPVGAGADPLLFARSADEYLCDQAQDLIRLIEGWKGQEFVQKRQLSSQFPLWAKTYTRLVGEAERHSTRLRLGLARTCSTLLDANRLMLELNPSANLPSVSSG